jgi:hypothetical protein
MERNAMASSEWSGPASIIAQSSATKMAFAYLLRAPGLIAHLLECVRIVADHDICVTASKIGASQVARHPGRVNTQESRSRIYGNPNRDPLPLTAHTGHICTHGCCLVSPQQLFTFQSRHLLCDCLDGPIHTRFPNPHPKTAQDNFDGPVEMRTA